jgi:hypothetical protein
MDEDKKEKSFEEDNIPVLPYQPFTDALAPMAFCEYVHFELNGRILKIFGLNSFAPVESTDVMFKEQKPNEAVEVKFFRPQFSGATTTDSFPKMLFTLLFYLGCNENLMKDLNGNLNDEVSTISALPQVKDTVRKAAKFIDHLLSENKSESRG